MESPQRERSYPCGLESRPGGDGGTPSVITTDQTVFGYNYFEEVEESQGWLTCPACHTDLVQEMVVGGIPNIFCQYCKSFFRPYPDCRTDTWSFAVYTLGGSLYESEDD